MLSWVNLHGINAHSAPPPARKLAGTNLHCLVNRGTGALVACPELLVRKLVDSGIRLTPTGVGCKTAASQKQ